MLMSREALPREDLPGETRDSQPSLSYPDLEMQLAAQILEEFRTITVPAMSAADPFTAQASTPGLYGSKAISSQPGLALPAGLTVPPGLVVPPGLSSLLATHHPLYVGAGDGDGNHGDTQPLEQEKHDAPGADKEKRKRRQCDGNMRLVTRCMPARHLKRSWCHICWRRVSNGTKNKKAQTYYGCTTCNVHLCIPECFVAYHTLQDYS